MLWSKTELSQQNASFVCLSGLDAGLGTLGCSLGEARLFLADVGPGSFTGVRVGVMLAKTLAWTQGALCGGADAFDLVSPDRVVALPSKKGEFFVRPVGGAPVRQVEVPLGAVGYGFGGSDTPPLAERFGAMLGSVQRLKPEELAPRYLIEASISQPKKPLSRRPSA